MRSILFLLLLSLPGFTQAQGSPDILAEKPLQDTIEVEISNAPVAVTQVYLTYRDLITYKKEKIFPQDDNEQKLRSEFKKYNVQDIQLVINDQTLTLLVAPEEQISLKCSVTAEGLEPIFSGESASFQSTYHKLFNTLQELDALHKEAQVESPPTTSNSSKIRRQPS